MRSISCLSSSASHIGQTRPFASSLYSNCKAPLPAPRSLASSTRPAGGGRRLLGALGRNQGAHLAASFCSHRVVRLNAGNPRQVPQRRRMAHAGIGCQKSLRAHGDRRNLSVTIVTRKESRSLDIRAQFLGPGILQDAMAIPFTRKTLLPRR